jgi:hypothetical protein
MTSAPDQAWRVRYLGTPHATAVASRSRHPSVMHRQTRVLLLALSLGISQATAAANPNPTTNPSPDPTLLEAVAASTNDLRQSWNTDPTTARLPFPKVQLLPPGVDASGACTPGAPAREPAPTAIDCANRDVVLLEHDLLQIAYRLHQGPAVSYWIAVGLAERLQPRRTVLSPAATSLQRSCLAGTLLGAEGPIQPADVAERAVKAAAKAYGDLFSLQVGSGAQRAYALLSGLGATELDCGATAMARLAAGQVPIPADLGTRGPGTLGREAACRQPPSCPRPLLSSTALGGV